jgi:enoyl-CoA hydratase/carnithine racemase
MSHILVERQGAIQRIRMNRPEKKNALTTAMYTAFAEAIRAADGDAGVRVMLIEGAGDAFTAGNDLQDFLAHAPQGGPRPVLDFLQVFSHAAKPIVAAVHGVAVGVGTTMLAHCDLVYAAEGARFSMPFVNLGLCTENASSFLLPRSAAISARRSCSCSASRSMREGARGRLVNAVVPRRARRDRDRGGAETRRQAAGVAPPDQAAAAARLDARDRGCARRGVEGVRRAALVPRSERGFHRVLREARAGFLAVRLTHGRRPAWTRPASDSSPASGRRPRRSSASCRSAS